MTKKKQTNEAKVEKDSYWLYNQILPILRANKEKSFDEWQLARLIQAIAEDELYDMWTQWIGEKEAKWSAKDNKSFILWIKGGCEMEA